MKAIDLILKSFEFSEHLTTGIVADLREHALVRTSNASTGLPGNHTLWILGHLAWVEGSVPQIIMGESNRAAHLEPLCGMGSVPKDDAAAYPAFDELLRTYQELRAANIRLLHHVGEAGLDKAPKWVPPGLEKEMDTAGRTFLLIAQHNLIHFGQLTDIRRAAGFKPRF